MILKTFWQKFKKTEDKLSEIKSISDKYNYKTNISMRFSDFDMMGHVNNSIYFTYLEIARANYWDEIVKWDWKKTGIVIGHAEIDYFIPILMDDKIAIHVKTSRIGTTSFDLDYQIVKVVGAEEIVCSKGKTVCIAIDYDNKKSVKISDVERQRMIDFEQLSS